MLTVNAEGDSAIVLTVPLAVVTVMGPVLDPLATTALNSVSVSAVMTALTPPMFTDSALPSPEPYTVTTVPTGPLTGSNRVRPGESVNGAEDSMRPVGVVMRMPPLVAAAGTVVVICVSLSTVNTG